MRWSRRAFLWATAGAAALGRANRGWARQRGAPAVTDQPAGAGRRVLITAPEYRDTSVRHSLYLPDQWRPVDCGDARLPVIVEYAGNYAPKLGCSGRVEDAVLGFGATMGEWIWLVLPFVSPDGLRNQRTWWGDVRATVAYAKQAVARTCEQFGGDPNRVVLCGFSRGAIAVNYIGLHDEEIAGLWRGFFTHDHYDGVREWKGTRWGSPLKAYRQQAAQRWNRIAGRPVLISQQPGVEDVRKYLGERLGDNVRLISPDVRSILGEFPNATAVHPHTDRWLLKPSRWRADVRTWMERTVEIAKPRQADDGS